MRDLSIDTGYFPSLSFLEKGKTNNSFFTAKVPRLQRYELQITKNRREWLAKVRISWQSTISKAFCLYRQVFSYANAVHYSHVDFVSHTDARTVGNFTRDNFNTHKMLLFKGSLAAACCYCSVTWISLMCFNVKYVAFK